MRTDNNVGPDLVPNRLTLSVPERFFEKKNEISQQTKTKA